MIEARGKQTPSARRPAGAGRPVAHMIGNAHIDHAWLWQWPEARDEVYSTCRSALDRMNEFPEFVFSFSSAVSYEWIEENRPAMFAEIKQRVAEGRWNIVGGWYVQPDCNIPSGEAFVRQVLYGKRYFQEKFGVDVKVGYNVDTFGHAGTLPQILAKSGMTSYIFFRPGPREMELPGLFWWRADDGSQVLACRPPYHYNSRDESLQERIAGSAQQRPATVGNASAGDAASGLPIGDVMSFYGVGNHGGGPTIRNIESIIAFNREHASDPEAAQALFSTPDAFFAAALATATDYPVVATELQHHSRGCYSVLGWIKQANRQAEHSLGSAESLAAIASAAFGQPYPRAELTAAWKLVLFNQFHDIIAGTCIPEAYDDCRDDYRRVHHIANAAENAALDTIASRVDTSAGAALIVFNPLPWRRADALEVAFETKHLDSNNQSFMKNVAPAGVRLTDASGMAVPAQLGRIEHVGGGYRVHMALAGSLPGLGYRAFKVELIPGQPGTGAPTAVQAGAVDSVLENECLRAVVDPSTGWLTSLFDKSLGVELLARPAGVPVVIDDPSDTWSHDVISFRDEVARFSANGNVRVVEQGPVRKVVRATSRRGDSIVEQEFSLRAGARQIEVAVRVDWREQWRMLKLAFPLALGQSVPTYEAPYGQTTRTANGEEEPGQQWLDVSGTTRGGQAAGVALLNDAKYGFDVLETSDAVGSDTELRLTVLRSPAFAFHEPRTIEPNVEYNFIDQGEQRFRYALVAHAGGPAAAEIARRAFELNVPVVSRIEPAHAGTLPSEQSFLEVEPAGVVGGALKGAEDGDGLIVRLIETTGAATSAKLRLSGFGPASGTAEVTLGAHEIKSLRISGERVTAVDLIERPIS